MSTQVLSQSIETSGNYFADLHTAIEAGLVKDDKRHYPKKDALYVLIDQHNASIERLSVTDVDELDVEIDFDSEPVASKYVDPFDEDLVLDDTISEPEPVVTTVVPTVTAKIVPDSLESVETVRTVVAKPQTASGIKPVRFGTRKHLIFQELLLGITIAALAAKYSISKTYALDYPNMARKAGYVVEKDADGTYRIILPVTVDHIFTA